MRCFWVHVFLRHNTGKLADLQAQIPCIAPTPLEAARLDIVRKAEDRVWSSLGRDQHHAYQLETNVLEITRMEARLG